MEKQTLKHVLATFDDEADLDAFLEKVYLLKKIEAGERDIAAGETISHEDAKKRLEKWLV